MKKNENKKPIERFSYRFTTLMLVLSVAAVLLSVLAAVVSAFRIAENGLHGFYDWLQSPLLILICAVALTLVISLWIRSEYVVTDKTLVSRFGLMKSVCEISKITAIVYDTQLKKLTVYLGEQFFVTSLKEGQTESFVRALLDRNEKIDYSFTVTENKPQSNENDQNDENKK